MAKNGTEQWRCCKGEVGEQRDAEDGREAIYEELTGRLFVASDDCVGLPEDHLDAGPGEVREVGHCLRTLGPGEALSIAAYAASCSTAMR